MGPAWPEKKKPSIGHPPRDMYLDVQPSQYVVSNLGCNLQPGELHLGDL